MMNYIDPVAFKLFNAEVRWYAIFILLGVVLAVIAGVREGKKIGIPSEYIYTGVCIVLPCAILGARLWWDLFNIDKIHSFIDVFAIWDGGLAIQGGSDCRPDNHLFLLSISKIFLLSYFRCCGSWILDWSNLWPLGELL